jgi:carboxyl-terminal processing protease
MYDNPEPEQPIHESGDRGGSGFGRPLAYGLAFVFACGAFFSGIQIGQGVHGHGQAASLFSIFGFEPEPVVADNSAEQPDLTEFWEVWDLLEEKFAVSSSSQQLSVEERVQGAINGLVDAYGDPYTVYLPPEDNAAFQEDISGEFSGVGMEVGLREGLVTVIAPLPDTPANKAGVLAGDVIVRIDETSTEGMRIDEAVKLIRGERGTEVVLQIYREGESEFLTIPIVRDTIDIPTVRTELRDEAFIISLYSFNAVAERQFQDALREYLQSGREDLIVDVRGNPGGYLRGAVNISSYFLPAGKVVVQEQFNDSEMDDVYRSRGRQVKDFDPQNLVVLVDGGSASAAEILAGALQDHDTATLIGTRTFGKGSVQELVDLDGGSSLKVTVARWLTPNGVSFSDGGLTPDITINRTAQQIIAGEDPQLQAALDFLAGREVQSETFEEAVIENGADEADDPDAGEAE